MGLFSLNPNYREFLEECNAHEVEYLVIGGQAVIYYGYARTTKDLDIWVNPTRTNAERVYKAVKEFGIVADGITVEWFTKPNSMYGMGLYPYRIELLTGIPGVHFTESYARRSLIDVEGLIISFIHVDDLITNKLAVARKSDLADVAMLRKRKKR